MTAKKKAKVKETEEFIFEGDNCYIHTTIDDKTPLTVLMAGDEKYIKLHSNEIELGILEDTGEYKPILHGIVSSFDNYDIKFTDTERGYKGYGKIHMNIRYFKIIYTIDIIDKI